MHGAYFITAFEIFVFTLKMINSNDRQKYNANSDTIIIFK